MCVCAVLVCAVLVCDFLVVLDRRTLFGILSMSSLTVLKIHWGFNASILPFFLLPLCFQYYFCVAKYSIYVLIYCFELFWIYEHYIIPDRVANCFVANVKSRLLQACVAKGTGSFER